MCAYMALAFFNILVAGSSIVTETSTVITSTTRDPEPVGFFQPANQTAEVSEDAAPNTVFYTLQAQDPAANSTGTFSFAAIEPITAVDKHGRQVNATDIFKSFFAVEPSTGEVSVARALQRDVAAVVTLTVQVTEATAPDKQQSLGVLEINIIDVNDYAPMFAAPWTEENPRYTLELLEEQPAGAVVGAVVARDADSPVVSYALEPDSEFFSIDNATGTVRTKKRIDYEANKSLNLTVVAYDSGTPQKSATADVTVDIVNVNDMSPVFSQNQYEAKVTENARPGTHVTTVQALDGDDGEFGTVTYSLVGEHSAGFSVDHSTGEVTVGRGAPLDYETTPEVTLQVMASDGAPPDSRRYVAVPVHIRLLDLNDNSPVFDQRSYSVKINENVSMSPPVPILKVHAEDKDEGRNGDVRYAILSGNVDGVFYLDAEEGTLTPTTSLRNIPRELRLVVEGRDGQGRGPHAQNVTINVTIQGVNENQPLFIMPAFTNATVEVPQNVGVANYLVMTVKATDKDVGENGHLTYHLKVDNENVQETEQFTIDADTGELRTKVVLDKDNRDNYSLVLVARDHGWPTAYETQRFLTVLLVDTCNNTPEFPLDDASNPYRFRVPENVRQHVFIGKVSALRGDEGNTTKVFYYIVAGNEDGSFYLNKSDGSIFSRASFDRERKDEYNLYIKASHEANFSVTLEQKAKLNQPERDLSVVHVQVTILDENDNPPRFERSDYYAGIDAMANINKFVVQLHAEDPDEGINGSLSYYITATYLFRFSSNRSSDYIVPSPFNVTEDGRVVTANYMAEYNQGRFVLDVVARERAPPEREARTRVHVWIFEPDQLIRVILSRSSEEVHEEREEIIAELSNITRSRVVIDDIRYHVDSSGRIRHDWCDMYVHVVDGPTQAIAAISDVLKVIDAKYDYLKDYYAGLAIENILPAFVGVQEETLHPALAAFAALLTILLVGGVTAVAACCCLRHWVIALPLEVKKKKKTLIKKEILDDSETPLWIEQRMKLYQEQELTTQFFSEPTAPLPALACRDDATCSQMNNPYPPRRGSEGIGGYASTSGRGADSGAHSLLWGSPRNVYEATEEFPSSSYHVPEQPLGASSMDSYWPRAASTKNTGVPYFLH